MQEKLIVCGTLIVPVYYPVSNMSKEQALKNVKVNLSSRAISVLDGDLHTWNGKSYPIIAPNCRTIWTDVQSEQGII